MIARRDNCGDIDSMLSGLVDFCGVQVCALASGIGCPSAYISYAVQGTRPLPRKYRQGFTNKLINCSRKLKRLPLDRLDILDAIDDCHLDVTLLASKLGVSRSTLSARLHRSTTSPEKLLEVQLVMRSIGRDIERAVKLAEKDARQAKGKKKAAK